VDSQGEQTNPADDAVVADTGALDAGMYEVLVTASSSADAQFALQRRNAANDTTVGDVIGFYTATSTPVQLIFTLFVDHSQRLRVIMDDALTGTCWVSIVATRVQ
jgi:hypothetical protein